MSSLLTDHIQSIAWSGSHCPQQCEWVGPLRNTVKSMLLPFTWDDTVGIFTSLWNAILGWKELYDGCTKRWMFLGDVKYCKWSLNPPADLLYANTYLTFIMGDILTCHSRKSMCNNTINDGWNVYYYWQIRIFNFPILSIQQCWQWQHEKLSTKPPKNAFTFTSSVTLHLT